MPESTASKRERLITVPVVILLGIIIVVLLALLFPSKGTFEDQRYTKNPDQLSIAYLKTIFKLRPSDIGLRFTLAQQYISISKWQEAKELLDDFIAGNKKDIEKIALIKAQIFKVRYEYADKKNPKRYQLLNSAQNTIKNIDLTQLDMHDLSILAKIALGINRPDLAANIYKQLAKTDVRNETKWWAKAGKWARASSQPELASTYYLNAYRTVRTQDEGSAYAGLSVISSLEANQKKSAIKALKKYILEFPNNKYFLETIVSAYSMLGDFKKASIWNRKLWLKYGQNSEEITLRQLNLEMAVTHLKHAREYAVKLVSLNKNNRKYKRQLAQLYEWTNMPITAQNVWEQLIRNSRTPYEAEQALRLAIMNYDEPSTISAIKSIAKKRKLTNKEILEKISSYERQGELNLTQKALNEYLKENPKNKEKWFELAELYENQNKYESAVKTWGKIEQVFSDENFAVAKQIELHWNYQHHEEAYSKTKNINQDFSKIKSIYHLEILSELGWRFKDKNLLRKSNKEIVLRDKKNIRAYKWLLHLADEQGDVEDAVVFAEAAWKNTGKTIFLRLAIDTAIEKNDRVRIKYLLNLALQNNKNINDMASYITIVAEIEDKNKRYLSSSKYYEYALKLNPRVKSVHVAFLWSLLNSHQRKKLKRYLTAFENKAVRSSRYWPVYAAATYEIGDAEKSVYWHRKIMNLHPEDDLWKLTYAEALESNGQYNSAYKIRLYMLNKMRRKNQYATLRSQPFNKLAQHYINLEKKIGVSAKANDLIKVIIAKSKSQSNKKKVPYEFLVAWYGSLKQDDMSRYWHLQRQFARMKSPDNQKLTFALAGNDTTTIYNIVTRNSKISPVDRNEGYIQLGLYETALSSSLEGIGVLSKKRERLAYRVQAASISSLLPNSWSTEFDRHSNGVLAMSSLNFFTNMSLHNWSYGLSIAKNKLDIDNSIVNLAGNNLETEFGFSVKRPGRDFVFSTDIKVNQRGDKNIFPVKLKLNYSFSNRIGFEFGWEKNQFSEESSELRTLGLQDSLSIGINTNITNREYFNARISNLKYKSRWEEPIATGWRTDMNIGHKIMRGSNNLALQFDVNWLSNTLKNSLGTQIAQRLPVGATNSLIVAKEFGSLGLSLRFSRGGIKSNYPQTGSFRYYTDVWLGKVFPSDNFAYRFSTGFGSRILGNDELSFEIYADQTVNKVNGFTSWGATLQYKNYLGR